MQQNISFKTPNAPWPNPVIPQAVIAGGVIYVSGTTGVDPETGSSLAKATPNKLNKYFATCKLYCRKPVATCRM